jgi:hypothetical protein
MTNQNQTQDLLLGSPDVFTFVSRLSTKLHSLVNADKITEKEALDCIVQDIAAYQAYVASRGELVA